MKKKFLVMGIICVSLAVFASCSVTPVVWDDRFPEEELCEIYFEGGTIRSYNGIPVSGKGWNEAILKVYTIKIPAGESEFTGNFKYMIGNTTFYANRIVFNHNFEAGKMYTVALRSMLEGWASDAKRSRGDWAIRIFSYEETLYKDGKLEASIPLDLK